MSATKATVSKLRGITGIVIFIYVVVHMSNHIVGLVSLSAADAMLDNVRWFWHLTLAAIILYASLFIHAGLGVFSVISKYSFRIRLIDWVQLGTGLLIPWILIGHAFVGGYSTRFLGVKDSYELTTLATWVFDPVSVATLSFLLILAWGHGVIGVNNMLRFHAGYQRIKPMLVIVAWLFPVLSLLGFASAGKEIIAKVMVDPNVIGQVMMNAQLSMEMAGYLTQVNVAAQKYYPFVLALLIPITFVLFRIRNRKKDISITYPGNKVVHADRGISVLDASRQNSIPHMSMCGGRGRCSTCRIRVMSDLSHLPERNAIERNIADKLKWDDSIRLACQLHIDQSIEVRPLVRSTSDELTTNSRGALSGREEHIVVMFIDLRNFTPISENLLPYDTVYLLNQYIEIASKAIASCNGRIDKIIGDGVMALFVDQDDQQKNARNALKASQQIAEQMASLSKQCQEDFGFDLRFGIGIHSGLSVVGQIGHGKDISETAIGDCVNIASRLEQLTKAEKSQLIISMELMQHADLKAKPDAVKNVRLKGKSKPLEVCVFNSATALFAH
ncbi:MAG: adenylate/guanylate cyclase domain-containing protein [Alphaproteobacteria bacterium]|nr:adenylate/guanylate cyclase domain-containing protein [Alphaproteobacteria bacterium]